MLKSSVARLLNIQAKSCSAGPIRIGGIQRLSTSAIRKNQSSSPPAASTSIGWLEDNLELKVRDSEQETYVESVPGSTGREGKVIEASSSSASSAACSLCRLNIKNLKYTDVMILSQFIKKNGTLVTYHESKLCGKQYRKVKNLIAQAQRCNLIDRPAGYLVPGAWHDLNTYLEPDRKRDNPMRIVKKEFWK